MQDRELGEEVALAQILESLSRAVSLSVDAETTLFDHVHRAGGITLAHDDLGGADLHRLQ